MSEVKTNQQLMQEAIASMTPEQRTACFPPKTMKNFVVRKSWFGRGQILKFTNNKGVEITYDHDIAMEIMLPRLELSTAWDKYGYWSQSTDLPLSLRFRDLLNRPEPEVVPVVAKKAKK
jgi:hypothetical protein